MRGIKRKLQVLDEEQNRLGDMEEDLKSAFGQLLGDNAQFQSQLTRCFEAKPSVRTQARDSGKS